MIATLYYDNSYFINRKNIARRTSPYSPYRQKRYKNNEKSYVLNRSLNNNIKSYMSELASNFNGLKNISNNIYEKISSNFSMKDLQENFGKFADSYNNFVKFIHQNEGGSKKFKKILNSLQNTVESNEEILDDLGIKLDNDFLNFDTEKYNKSIIDLSKIKNFCSDIYSKICDFMKEPMSNYMNFKDFSYYFNYSSDYNKNNAFKVIEQGMVVDISL